MLKLIRELGPLAVAVAVFGAVIAVLLQSGSALGNWLLAAFLVGHGWVHVMYVMPQPVPKPATAGRATAQPWPFELSHSWLLSGLGFRAGTLRPLGALLVAATVAGYAVAALATIPLVVPASAWAMLVLASTLASALLLGLFANRGLIIGIAIDIVLLIVVLASLWVPAV